VQTGAERNTLNMQFMLCQQNCKHLMTSNNIITPWLQSTRELYRLSDRRLSTKLMPTFTDGEVSRRIPTAVCVCVWDGRGYRIVNVKHRRDYVSAKYNRVNMDNLFCFWVDSSSYKQRILAWNYWQIALSSYVERR
jgi:hypothetical protein